MSNPNFIALATIARREVSRILRIWTQTLIPPAITMTLYFLIFGGLIGSRVGKMGGMDYMQFIVPGLVMMSVIQNSYGNVSSSFFSAKFGRYVEELLVSPMPSWVILGGYITGAVLRRCRSRRPSRRRRSSAPRWAGRWIPAACARCWTGCASATATNCRRC